MIQKFGNDIFAYNSGIVFVIRGFKSYSENRSANVCGKEIVFFINFLAEIVGFAGFFGDELSCNAVNLHVFCGGSAEAEALEESRCITADKFDNGSSGNAFHNVVTHNGKVLFHVVDIAVKYDIGRNFERNVYSVAGESYASFFNQCRDRHARNHSG